MSHLSSLFTKVPVDIPNRSGFDMSHENLLTMKVGTLTPILTEELLPGDSYSCGCLSQITLPPMATDFYGRIDLRLEAFFVPFRILWGGWEGFWTTPISNPFQASSSGFLNRDSAVPHAFVSYSSSTYSYMNELFGAGSLSDYLGAKFEFSSPSATTYYVVPNILPYVAYHKIYDDWYRRSDVQKPLFGRPSNTTYVISGLPYSTAYTSASSTGSWSATDTVSHLLSGTAESTSYPLNFPDGVSLFQLRQRNWTKDYFQTAHLYPQSNDSVSGIAVDAGTDITIPDIRTANVLQRYIERLNVCGLRYSDQIKGVFGVDPSDAILDRAVFLGSSKFGIYNKTVYSTAESSGTNTQGNPWSGFLAGSGAASKGMGDCSLIDNFTAKEHGYIMVLASIVPHQYYSTGSRRYLARFMPADFANPLLQGLGEQPICKWELNNDPTDYFTCSSASLPDDTQADSNSLSGLIGSTGSWLTGGQTTDYFGYAQQYAEYKYHDDEVHGLLRSGENLSAFALQTAYDDAELSSDFLQIPTDYLDLVTAVESALSEYGAWADFYFNAKKVSTLSEYVIPTLGDLKNTHKEKVNYNGTML